MDSYLFLRPETDAASGGNADGVLLTSRHWTGNLSGVSSRITPGRCRSRRTRRVVPLGEDKRVSGGLNRFAVCNRVFQVAQDGRRR